MGIFDFFKSSGKDKINTNEHSLSTTDFENIINEARIDLIARHETYWFSLKVSEIPIFKNKIQALTAKQKISFILQSGEKTHLFYKQNKSYGSDNHFYQKMQLADSIMRQLLRTKLEMTDDDFFSLVTFFANHKKHNNNGGILYWPINLLVTQIEKHVSEKGLSTALKETINYLKLKIKEHNDYYERKEQLKLMGKLETLLFDSDQNNTGVKPTYFRGNDDFAIYANGIIKSWDHRYQQLWFRLMIKAEGASGGKPSKKFTDEMKLLFQEFGSEKYKQILNDWFSFIIKLKEKVASHTNAAGTYTYQTVLFLAPPTIDMLKGFIWSFIHFFDKATLFNLAQLADRCYKKIPGQGPAAAAVGNACIYVLAHTKGMDGLGHLSRLKIRIKQAGTQKTIEKYLLEAAEKQGVALHEIEDMAVDDFELIEGQKEYELEGYKAILQITGVGKTNFSWNKPDGTPQKSDPVIVKQKHALKLKKIKNIVKQIEFTVSAQRDRLDRMFKWDRKISGSAFKEFYFDHGLMSWLTKKIIWTLENGGVRIAIFFKDGNWCDQKGDEVTLLFDDDSQFSLWHPVFETVENIEAWRKFMINHKIVQPLKQAYREVYLLTDAEINTGTYSNRMAAHILKQHQFNSLAKIRGWKYSLMGAWDGNYGEFASLDLSEYGLRAEFWINEISADDAMNDSGIWSYISTDQLRFTDSGNNSVKEIVDIPAILLSEILRDLDLFVGVASVGNDPNWRDNGGLRGYNDYWQSYSFGDLTEVAKTRRSILENLLPRLKIAKVAVLKDKFLVVKGNIRTYKIHLGSTNILMEPNDQYLCIVPERGKKDMLENNFLPFEGDNGLSVILSKAILLADDDKIKDSTITSQINYKK